MMIFSAVVIVLLLVIFITAFWSPTLLGSIFNARREDPYKKPVPEVKSPEEREQPG